MSMRIRTASAAALAAMVAAPTVAAAKPADVRIPLPTGWQPEGIAAAPDGDLYVGSVATGDVRRVDPQTGRQRTAIDAPAGSQANGLQRIAGYVVVTGNRTGEINLYRESNGKRTNRFRPAPDGAESFTNDVAVAGRRAYVTDSSRPVLYELVLRRKTVKLITHPLSGITYDEGINLNGIAVGRGKTLYTVQSNTGKLFRLTAGSGALKEVDTGGYALTNGDGIERRGDRLYVVQNRSNLVAVLKLSRGGGSAKLVKRIKSRDFSVPTTAVFQRGKLYAVNARFGIPAPTTSKYWITNLGRRSGG